jgi:hypothetical protein
MKIDGIDQRAVDVENHRFNHDFSLSSAPNFGGWQSGRHGAAFCRLQERCCGIASTNAAATLPF